MLNHILLEFLMILSKQNNPYCYLDEIAIITNYWTIDISEIDNFTNSFLKKNPQYSKNRSYYCDFLGYILFVDGLLYNDPILNFYPPYKYNNL